MAGITGNTSFELDGKTTVTVGEWGNFQWFAGPRAWMGPVDIGPSGSVPPGIDVDITLSGGNWDMHTLRINGGAQFDVKIRDTTSKGAEPVWIERIGLSHGSSDVVLTNASVQFINGGRGDDDITTGSGFYGQVRLNIGNNKAKTGAGWVDSITAGDGNDEATIGDGGAGSVNLNHGNNKFVTGNGWVDSIVGRTGNDQATIGKGGAGSVNLSHGDNSVTTGQGIVGSIILGNGTDTVSIGSGGIGCAYLGLGNDLAIVSKLSDKDMAVVIQGGGGQDTIDFSKLSRGIEWNAGSGFAEGKDGRFFWMDIENVIGTKKRDTLLGNDDDNAIDGGKGKDKITGAEGADDLTGGAGKDTFIFLSAKDSTVSGKGRDLIIDFNQKQKDKIDLREIGKLSFIGGSEFSNKAGELRFEQDDGVTTVFGDLDGNGSKDFAIDLDGNVALKAGDFIL